MFTAAPTGPTNIMFAYTYRNSQSGNIDVIENVITEFTRDLQSLATPVSVGVVSQPCVGGSTSLMAVGRFLKELTAARSRSNQHVGLAGLVRKLRVDVFSDVPRTDNRVAVLFVDQHTQDLRLLEEEIRKLRFKNVKVVAIAVGGLKGGVMNSLQDLHSSGNLIAVESYASLQEQKLPLFDIIFGMPEYYIGSSYSHTFNLGVDQQPESGLTWSKSFLSREESLSSNSKPKPSKSNHNPHISIHSESLNYNSKPKASKSNHQSHISIHGYAYSKSGSGKNLVNKTQTSTTLAPRIIKKNKFSLISSLRRADTMTQSPPTRSRSHNTRRVTTLPPMPLL